MDLKEIINTRLPFPLVRIIIEYVGLFPTNLTKVVKRTNQHINNKYCHRCGEYIVAGNRRTNLKHISCRYRKYTKDKYQTKHYHVQIVSLLELLYEKYYHAPMIMSGVICPLVFYSKQPKSGFHLNNKHKWTFYENKMITNLHKNPNFSIIPNMFDKKQYYNLFDLSQQETRVVFMGRYKQNTKNDVFRTMFNLSYNQYHHVGKRLWFAMGKIWDYVQQNPDMKITVSRLIGMDSILRFHPEWTKTLLYDHPIILQNISEKKIKKFFNENQDWFLQYIEDCPQTLTYITLYKEKLEEVELVDLEC
jgi:hypothetical protein